jgi:hypothetical protein
MTWFLPGGADGVAAGLTEKLWSWEDVIAMINATNPQKKRGRCRKRRLESVLVSFFFLENFSTPGYGDVDG